ncbi:hypothetical protein DSO57_1024091 [Entomophthora muscae]|uniref:Uncharacterized protein n=1 Tax=Entomophthora muscae TaxID=34485 RepID=A0ACC2SFK4_9FUNG|nr:hypothetical protein DSO57_1024091 [Entomophthora muscae]
MVVHSLWLLLLLKLRPPSSSFITDFEFLSCPPSKRKPMLDPFVKFVVFTLAPALVMIWSMSPDLWTCISHSFYHVGSNPSQFLHMFEDISGQAQEILVTSENVVKSLTCNNLELSAIELVPPAPPGLVFPVFPLSKTPVVPD